MLPKFNKGSQITSFGDLDWAMANSSHIFVRDHCYLTQHVESYTFWRLRELLREGEMFTAVSVKDL